MERREKSDQICSWCGAMPAATVDNAFGPQTEVYRVGEKIFALVAVEHGDSVTLKSLPEEGEALRAQYDFVREGYHMNKRHWITIDLMADVPMDEVQELIEESYRLVFESLPRGRQRLLNPD